MAESIGTHRKCDPGDQPPFISIGNCGSRMHRRPVVDYEYLASGRPLVRYCVVDRKLEVPYDLVGTLVARRHAARIVSQEPRASRCEKAVPPVVY